MSPADLPPLSLLYPPDYRPPRERPAHPACGGHCAEDLGLDDLAREITSRPEHLPAVRAVLLELNPDPRVIVYRQEVVQDLLERPSLAEYLRGILPQLSEIAHLSSPSWKEQTPLQQLLWRLSELEMFVDIVRGLEGALSHADVRSEALRLLRDELHTLAADASFTALAAQLPALRKQVAGLQSMTIGVNLDAQLRPIGAVLLAISNEPFTEQGLVSKLLGRKSERYGIGPLHSLQETPEVGSQAPLMHPLFRDLNTVLLAAARPAVDALDAFAALSTRPLVALAPELVYYLGAARLIARLRDLGLPVTLPTVLPAEERAARLVANYNPHLALHLADTRRPVAEELVTNDVAFGDDGRILIITGPNRGGKTTYTQAVGLTQVMMQAGLYVPAEQAALSPVDAIYTHFPVAERDTLGAGRLGEEAARLHELFQHATRHSLALLNESLFSTNPGESLYLARDIVAALRLLGARAIYTTHLHELAEDLDKLNAETPGDSRALSLVAGVVQTGEGEHVRSTFRIEPGPPRGLSYAHEIAARYGIRYDQLAEELRNRGAVS